MEVFLVLIIELIICCAILIVPITLLLTAYIVESVALYKLANKAGIPNAWLVWIPFISHYTHLYILSELAGDQPWEVELFKKKFTIKDRRTSFWIYVGAALVLPSLMAMILTVFCWFPPAYLLAYIPTIAFGIMQYVYLRDALNIFDADQEANKNSAIMVTILDNFIACGLARAILLHKVAKKEVQDEIVH